MSQEKLNINLTNWEIVGVNPNDKNWTSVDMFCFWAINIQSLIGLEKNLVNYEDNIYIDLNSIGDLAPEGFYDLEKAIVKSSNNYFFKLFRKIINQKKDLNTYVDSSIGLEDWSNYVKMFGLGSKLNFSGVK